MAPRNPIHPPREWTTGKLLANNATRQKAPLTQSGIPAVGVGVVIIMLESLGILGLQIAETRGLDIDQAGGILVRAGRLRGRLAVDVWGSFGGHFDGDFKVRIFQAMAVDGLTVW